MQGTSGLPDRLRLEMGVSNEMIRVSVGTEDTTDQIEDFSQALFNAIS